MRRPTRLVAALGVLVLAGIGSASAAVKVVPTGPVYRTYVAPAGALTHAGEVSLGVNWKSGAILFQGQLETRRILIDSAGDDTWRDVTGGLTGVVTLDAIAASDNATGRVFVSQLDGLGSLMAYTDNDGASWSSSAGSGLPAGYDHQSVGVGPYPAGSAPTGSFPDAVYYCSQETVAALCARSDDGGVVFGLSVAAWTTGSCGAIHGHIRVGPDGTVYVPNRSCTGRQGLAVSTDAGRTFTIRTVPGSTSGANGDPSFATGRDGTGYFGFADGTGRAMVSVTRTRGASWTDPYDLGKQVGVLNASFPETIAGDGDRAAVAFLGTKTAGDAQDAAFGLNADKTRYTGAEYHLYVATTYDRGRTWKTVDATPKDPVQRGRICLAGTTCTGLDRNLLDFMDIQVDRAGRVLVGWSDGCTGACVTSDLVADNSFSDKGTLTRQSAGRGLFAKPPPLR
ncbi:MAG: hypothetical protein JWM40_2059 [Frankiales bacterium]|nr:hypothetical protein [Frankiales bacterium]